MASFITNLVLWVLWFFTKGPIIGLLPWEVSNRILARILGLLYLMGLMAIPGFLWPEAATEEVA